jgi:hypothetical protein|tara:strand:- start:197 stop:391 length:195 start_codon:yes stop_codon:yes gene_type:complete
MPTVNGKKYPYTKEGKKKAEAAKKKVTAKKKKAAPRKSPFPRASKETIDGVNRTESAIRYLKRK